MKLSQATWADLYAPSGKQNESKAQLAQRLWYMHYHNVQLQEKSRN